ncbi:MAG TPA: metallophosphoesterase [Gemmatimonadales bacterium]|nr:metallophosphoesterase [Gemmatimonadales bacterium]
MNQHLAAVGLASALLGTAGCARSAPPVPAPVPLIPPSQLEVRLYLIGDAGDPAPGGEPVLMALRRELATRDGRQIVLFLGDNAYPRGLPAPKNKDRREAERRISEQVKVITGSGVTGYFILGNHDWAKYGGEGWDAVRRQEAFVDSAGQGKAWVLPSGGCPGPSRIDIGRLRLLLIDTQWWLHPGPKPRDPTSACATDAESEIVDSLRAGLAGTAGRVVVVAGHHPLVSGSIHGGHFGWMDHIFPLRNLEPWLWIPLPILGSLYPGLRQSGISSQDMSSGIYQRMIAALRTAFTPVPPSLFAAGHDHGLQVIAGRVVPLELVSGAGMYGHYSRTVAIRGSLLARKASGYARLDVPRTGRARLSVIEVDRTGRSHEVFSIWVNDPP